jgi:hypothetical protein
VDGEAEQRRRASGYDECRQEAHRPDVIAEREKREVVRAVALELDEHKQRPRRRPDRSHDERWSG